MEAGYKEGRAKDTFDASNYLASNSDLILYLGLDNSKAAQHYSINGFTEGRSLDSFDSGVILLHMMILFQRYQM